MTEHTSWSVRRAVMIMDGKAPDEIQREITREREKLAAEMNALAKEFIQKNYDNVLGPGVFSYVVQQFSLSCHDSLD